VGVRLYLGLSPRQQDIRMVPLGFGHGPGTIHEIQRLFEIGKEKGLHDMMFVDYFPVRKLIGVLPQFVAFQRWNTTAAWYTVLLGEARSGWGHSLCS
jgi:hypothetical protein